MFLIFRDCKVGLRLFHFLGTVCLWVLCYIRSLLSPAGQPRSASNGWDMPAFFLKSVDCPTPRTTGPSLAPLPAARSTDECSRHRFLHSISEATVINVLCCQHLHELSAAVTTQLVRNNAKFVCSSLGGPIIRAIIMDLVPSDSRSRVGK